MVKPLRGYCLIELVEKEKTVDGGFIQPDQLQQKIAKGKIIALGKAPLLGTETDFELELEVKKNDIVQFKRFGGEEVIGHENLMFVPYNQLLGVE